MRRGFLAFLATLPLLIFPAAARGEGIAATPESEPGGGRRLSGGRARCGGALKGLRQPAISPTCAMNTAHR
jgi:hypothetical protein